MTSAISVKSLTKTFILPHQKRTTLKESFVDFWQRQTYEKFAALSDVSFEVNRGEFFGIIGPNGCGKSTLLKILAGIYRPDSGIVTIGMADKGTHHAGTHSTPQPLSIASLLELGIGFQQDLSARENIFINGTLLGLTARQIRRLLPGIVEFAGIENFLDLKVKNFSSGMRQRLAFAIAAHIDADIYLCDEVLAVGDESFQKKCFDKINEFTKQKKTIILVTHSMENIKSICSRALLMEAGEVVAIGESQHVIEKYLGFTK